MKAMTPRISTSRGVTRARVLAFVAILAVLIGIIVVFSGARRRPIEATVIGFGTWVDGKSTSAFVRLHNRGNYPVKFLSQADGESVAGVICTMKTASFDFMALEYLLNPPCTVTSYVRIPEDEGIGRLEFFASAAPWQSPAFLRPFRNLLNRFHTQSSKREKLVDRIDIECSHRNSDGTLEPARVLPKKESNGLLLPE
jgi:hypothetical protein